MTFIFLLSIYIIGLIPAFYLGAWHVKSLRGKSFEDLFFVRGAGAEEKLHHGQDFMPDEDLHFMAVFFWPAYSILFLSVILWRFVLHRSAFLFKLLRNYFNTLSK